MIAKRVHQGRIRKMTCDRCGDIFKGTHELGLCCRCAIPPETARRDTVDAGAMVGLILAEPGVSGRATPSGRSPVVASR